ncbi:MAG: metal ABC transporter substrate-binding protein [Alphaproteobacteria bacterium]|nr:MAG: metal ABC transporter substrate-binding protein [Alphaproteobacteria bacterium]
MLSRRSVVSALATLPWVAGANQAAAQAAVSVIATTSVIEDFVSVVGGERVSVTALVGRNRDSHGFDPLPAQVRQVSSARLVVSNGAGLETWLPRTLQAAAYRGPQAVLSSGVTLRRAAEQAGDHSHAGHSHGANDPHIWQDPRRVQQMIRTLTNALVAVDPPGAEGYRARAAAYAAELQTLEGWVSEQLRPIPVQRRRAVVSHNSFTYFGERFSVDFRAPRITPTTEPSSQDIARLVRQIREQRITAVFLENITDPRLVERIAQEAGVKVGGKLYSDALSEPGGAAASYLEMMRHNARMLATAFRT